MPDFLKLSLNFELQTLVPLPLAPLEFFLMEQSYSSLHSGRSFAWDHVQGVIDDPCGAIADFGGVIADPCGIVAIPEAIGGRPVWKKYPYLHD